jgi:hypothetical protein
LAHEWRHDQQSDRLVAAAKEIANGTDAASADIAPAQACAALECDGPRKTNREFAKERRAIDSRRGLAKVSFLKLTSQRIRVAGLFREVTAGRVMAWAGKASSKQKTMMSFKSRRHPRSLPPPENPLGVPRRVMKQLAAEQLSSDPVAFNTRLQELLRE